MFISVRPFSSGARLAEEDDVVTEQTSVRLLSVAAFSFLSAYLLSFLFEGQVLYALLDANGLDVQSYVLSVIITHFFGLLSGGFLVTSLRQAKRVLLIGSVFCLLTGIPFFFPASPLWKPALLAAGFALGMAISAWGFYLHACTPSGRRVRTCADVLMLSNLFMFACNVVSLHLSCRAALLFAMLCRAAGFGFSWLLPHADKAEETRQKSVGHVKRPLLMLVLFIVVITINSGLMYQVINPAFSHLTGLISWYWALPYVTAIAVMRGVLVKFQCRRAPFLYIAMAMMLAAFLLFMLLGHSALDYLVINTLMLGSMGIFDLFWWSMIGEMLGLGLNSANVFGIGLSANVLGVWLGGILGVGMTSAALADAEVTAIALTVVCITLAILPPLEKQLNLIMKSHAYRDAYERMDLERQHNVLSRSAVVDLLTDREQDVLQQLLEGKSNREIAAALFITESTVKTHVRNIFSKCDVSSRAELISSFLKHQA